MTLSLLRVLTLMEELERDGQLHRHVVTAVMGDGQVQEELSEEGQRGFLEKVSSNNGTFIVIHRVVRLNLVTYYELLSIVLGS